MSDRPVDPLAGDESEIGSDVDAEVTDSSPPALPPSLGSASRVLATWAPVACIGLLTISSLVRNGVGTEAIARSVLYWIVGLLVPGVLVMRALIGGRDRWIDELAFGAATGLALELVAWTVLRPIGLIAVVEWWWIVVVAAFVGVPALRVHFVHRPPAHLPPGAAWALAAVCMAAIIVIDLGGFRSTPIPPEAGAVYHDLWWHLSFIHEMLRTGPVETPQIVGEALHYHYNAHIHLAVASETTGIAPEMMLFRLWIIPLVLTSLGLVAAVAQQVTRSAWAAPTAAWLTAAALAGGYVWPGISTTAASPFSFRSPSQVLANVFVVAGAAGLLAIVRGRASWGGLGWLALVLYAGSGAKPTVLAILLGGTVTATAVMLLRDRRAPRALLAGNAILLVLLAWMMRSRAGSSGARLTLFGSLRSHPVYKTLTGDTSLRGMNDGLLLDSLDDRTALIAAVATAVVLVGSQLVRLVGFGALVHHRTNRDLTAWWLAGSVASAWAVFAILDQVGYGQVYFVHTATPLGAVLTVWTLARFTDHLPARTMALGSMFGVGLGAVTAITAIGLTSSAARADGFGVLDTVAAPLIVVLLTTLLTMLLWRRARTTRQFAPFGMALLITAVLGAALPRSLDSTAGAVGSWIWARPPSVSPDDANYVTAGEMTGALWLREHSRPDDVVATNLHCRPPDDDREHCDARGYWLSGLSGRRIVLEGWAYTSENNDQHGEGGRVYARQPSPWPDRLALSDAAIAAPTPEILDTLRTEFGVEWLVGVHRSGPVSPRLSALADEVFDNREITVFRLRHDGS